jgi:hypothetical protein
LENTYRPLAAHAQALPTCPKCEKFISESHYQRHLQRCGTTHGGEPQTLSSAKAHADSSDRGISRGPVGEDRRGINWTKVAAVLVIFLLIGSLVVFFILYALSLL